MWGPASAFAKALADRRSFSGGWSAGPSSRHYFLATPSSASLAATSAPAVDVFTDLSM